MENGEKIYLKLTLEDIKNQVFHINREIMNINNKIIELSQLDYDKLEERIRELENYVATCKNNRIIENITELEKVTTALSVKAGIWGALGGILAGIGAYIISRL